MIIAHAIVIISNEMYCYSFGFIKQFYSLYRLEFFL